MITAGLILLAVGIVDLIRRYAPARRRWIFFLVCAVLLFVLSAGLDAAASALLAVGVAALWVVLARPDGYGRAGLWPAAGLIVVTAASVALSTPRTTFGPLGALWPTGSPIAQVSIDAAILVLGSSVFLVESANVIVRASLRLPAAPVDDPPRAALAADPPLPPLRGGRLIGPLERILVFALSLAGAFTLLAAVLAAKGIVRFPEISKDDGHGSRAEYFLVGSLASWVIALGCAFLVWWGSI